MDEFTKHTVDRELERKKKEGPQAVSLRDLYDKHVGKISDTWSLYLEELDRVLSVLRDQEIAILEIGVQNGGSLEIWSEYFPKAQKVVGVDIDPKCGELHFIDPRISVVISDATSEEGKRKVLQQAPAFDVIIDDGSHKSSDIVRAFGRYFPVLTEGGFYIVEDLHCSYWTDFEGGLHNPLSAMAFFRRLADITNYEHWRNSRSREFVLRGFSARYEVSFENLDLARIHSVGFINSLCIIGKAAPGSNVLGKRIVAGAEERVTSGSKRTNQTLIHDMPVNIEDDTRLDVFEVINAKNELREQLAGQEQATQHLQAQLAERDGQIVALAASVTDKEGCIRSLEEIVCERDSQISSLNQTVSERDAQITSLNQGIAERDNQIVSLDASVKEKEGRIASLEETVREKAGQLNSLNQTFAEREGQIISLNQAIAERDGQIAAFYNSRSWRITAPLRLIGTKFRQMINRIAIAKAIGGFTRTNGLRAGYRLFKGRRLLLRSSAFDANYYLRQNPDVAAARIDPSMHFMMHGVSEGRDPNAFFDTNWYLRQNPDVAEASLNPLVHYMQFGADEGRDPSSRFSGSAYLAANPDVAAAGMNPLLHYLKFGMAEGRLLRAWSTSDYISQTVAELDGKSIKRNGYKYQNNQKSLQLFELEQEVNKGHVGIHVESATIIGKRIEVSGWVFHSLAATNSGFILIDNNLGVRKFPLRIGIERADVYAAWQSDNALRSGFQGIALLDDPISDSVHIQFEVADSSVIRARVYPQPNSAIVGTSSSEGAYEYAYETLRATAAGSRTSDYVPLSEESFSNGQAPVKLIAFYLPQYHPIPENDRWWGKGFTEWTNVSKAIPQFVGHYQPRLPGELGFYDLRVSEVQQRQVELAKKHGIYGFCFHYYWFNGKRLLERPFEQFLNDRDIDFPFCICWANENWTRRWDGLDQEVLIAQMHSEESDLAFIRDVDPILRHPRYIRIKGRPLLIVYRAQLMPDPAATASRWKKHCREVGIGEPFLVAAQVFGFTDPREIGFDAAVEFPPNTIGVGKTNHTVDFLNPLYEGKVYSYTNLAEKMVVRERPPYTIFKTVCPDWDNEPRRPGRGHTFAFSTPDAYKRWLISACNYAIQDSDPEKRLVFINAWNEWAEGAYLEPDRRYGYAYLQATRDAMETITKDRKKRIVLVTHDAHPHGAQYNALNMTRVLTWDLGFIVDIVVLGEGLLKQEFSRYGQLHDLAGVNPEGKQARSLAARLYAAGAHAAICNTAVSGLFLSTLKRAGFRCVSLIHELPGIIRSYRLEEHVRRIAGEADVVAFAAEEVRAGFQEFSDLPAERVRIRSQGLYKRNRFAQSDGRGEARASLRSKLNLSDSVKIVLGVGYADHRKGIDLFVHAGIRTMQTRSDVVFVWVGHHDHDLWPQVMRIVEQSEHAKRFVFPGRVPISDTDLYYAGADVLALTSREDPFPSVVLESLEVGVPVVAFAGTGGCCDLINQGCGLLAPAFDVDAYAARILELLDNEEYACSLGKEGARRIQKDFSFRHYMYDVVDWLGEPLHRVSVIVPNYNYSRYLRERLESIARQTYPVFEIIFLDDASTDDSLSVASKILTSLSVDTRIVANTENSGSVFKQWRKGVEMAQGDLVWIAEADDLADPQFLQTLVSCFEDRSVVLAYCQSKQMATDGTILCEHYRDYTCDISSDKWSRPYTEDGLTEIRTALAVKNTIPNVSAVLFSRNQLLAALTSADQELLSYHIAGDWVVYLEVLKHGRITFTPTALNFHRRHQSSVTIGSSDILHLREIVSVQQKVQREFVVDDVIRNVADLYAQKLFVDFGLASKTGMDNYRQHPLIASANTSITIRDRDAFAEGTLNGTAENYVQGTKKAKYKRSFYLGAPFHVDLPNNTPTQKLLKATGNNTGNLLIGDAIRRHLGLSVCPGDILSVDPEHIVDLEQIEDVFDCIVIGAANFLYQGFDLSAYISFLERVRLPVVIVGVGAQAPSYESRVIIPEATKRMMRMISERSTTLGVRGWYSASVLNDIGIQNLRVIGCPSMYWTCSPNIQVSRGLECRAIAVNGSANALAHTVDPQAALRVESSLADLAYKNNYPYILQNELELIALVTGAESGYEGHLVRSLMDQYGLRAISEEEFIRFVKKHGRVFFRVDEWIQYARLFDMVIGTRFHGCLIALLAGIPAYMFVHDSRTREMCELLKLPHSDVREVEKIDLEDLHRSMDLNATETAYASLYRNYVEFLDENGLEHTLPERDA